MRFRFLAGLVLAASGLSACTSSTDALSVRPSADVVSSIAEPVVEPLANENYSVAQPQNPFPEASPVQPAQAQMVEPAVLAQAPLAQQVETPQPLAAQLPPPKVVQVASIKPESPAIVAPKPVAQSGKRFKVYGQKFRDAKPVKFAASRHPKRFEVHGVDVSHWQQKIDWKKLRTQGANFAFIKATEGGKHLDRLFKHNWKATKAAGIPRGAYHFMYWCRNAEEQANWFIRHVPKEAGALPPVLDVEWHGNRKTCPHKISKKRVLAKMKVFSNMIEKHYGQKPIIYTAPDFYEDNLKGQFKDHSFWLRSVAEHPKGRYPNRDFAFWQYSGTGLSKGVKTRIDLNVFNGTEESWQRWLQARLAK